MKVTRAEALKIIRNITKQRAAGVLTERLLYQFTDAVGYEHYMSTPGPSFSETIEEYHACPLTCQMKLLNYFQLEDEQL